MGTRVGSSTFKCIWVQVQVLLKSIWVQVQVHCYFFKSIWVQVQVLSKVFGYKYSSTFDLQSLICAHDLISIIEYM